MQIPEKIEMPAPTAWPLALAFGMTLVFAGFVTAASVSILGAILSVAGAVGWFRDVLPQEAEEALTVSEKAAPIFTARTEVERVNWITHEPHRSRLPLEIYPVSAGVKGGLAGSVAMALLAMIYTRTFALVGWTAVRKFVPITDLAEINANRPPLVFVRPIDDAANGLHRQAAHHS